MKRTSILAKNFLISLLVVSVVLGSVIALHIISGGVSQNIVEDVSSVINVTITNSDAGGNITLVNITFPTGVTYIAKTNGTNALTLFSNTSIELAWSNTTGIAIDSAGGVKSFRFNISVATPGRYNLTVAMTSNSTGPTDSQNISIIVNDTTLPSLVNFSLPTLDNRVNLSQTSIPVNVTYVDNGAISAVVINLYNLTGLVNASTTAVNSSSYFVNFTGLSDGVYYYNSSVNDTFNNRNDSVVTRIVNLDTTKPSSIEFVSPTLSNGANIYLTAIPVNITFVDKGALGYLNISLYNSTGLVNSSFTSLNSSYFVNFTGLTVGKIYYINATAVDSAGNRNDTSTRTVSLDTLKPSSVEFASPTPSNGANISVTSLEANVTFVDNGVLGNIVITLANSTALINTTLTATNSSYYFNFSGLPNDIYYLNASVNDTVGNINYSVTRTIILDTTVPVITLTKSSSGSHNLVIGASITDLSGVNATCLVSRSTASISGSWKTQTIAENNLVCDTAYTYVVTCSDTAGNTNSSSRIGLSTDVCESGGNGGSSSSATTATTSTTYVAPATELVSGFQRELSTSDKIQVAVGSSTHTITLVSTSSTSATITVASTPVTATMSVGEIKKFDSNSDGYYDISVTLVSLSGGKATISVKSINEQVPAVVSPPVVSQPEVTTPAAPEAQQPTTEVSEPSSGMSSTVIVVLIVIVVIIILVIVFRPKKKK